VKDPEAVGVKLAFPETLIGPLHAPDAWQLLAFVDDHANLTGVPLSTLDGVTLMVAVGGTKTVMPCVLDVLPPGPVHVSPYKYSPAGNGPTVWEPLVGSAPDHEPEATQDVVLLDVHVIVDVPPTGMLDGVKVNVIWGSGMTVRVADPIVVPSGPVQLRVYV
jgi:hypothetical protein